MSALRTDDAWQVKAACRGPQALVFFPPSTFERKDEKQDRERRAKAICATCPDKAECLAWALRVGEPVGIWGGTTPEERRYLRRMADAPARKPLPVIVVRGDASESEHASAA